VQKHFVSVTMRVNVQKHFVSVTMRVNVQKHFVLILRAAGLGSEFHVVRIALSHYQRYYWFCNVYICVLVVVELY
jgi:hypothetical protein